MLVPHPCRTPFGQVGVPWADTGDFSVSVCLALKFLLGNFAPHTPPLLQYVYFVQVHTRQQRPHGNTNTTTQVHFRPPSFLQSAVPLTYLHPSSPQSQSVPLHIHHLFNLIVLFSTQLGVLTLYYTHLEGRCLSNTLYYPLTRKHQPQVET